MPRRQRIEKSRRTILTFAQRFELESGYPSSSLEGHRSDFASEEHRASAWEDHRDELIALAEAEGLPLPWAYEFYDLGIPDPNREREERDRLEVDAIDEEP
jgi:hypothetical protein